MARRRAAVTVALRTAVDGPMPGHSPTMPIHYDLHGRLWQDNPSGSSRRGTPAWPDRPVARRARAGEAVSAGCRPTTPLICWQDAFGSMEMSEQVDARAFLFLTPRLARARRSVGLRRLS